MSSGFSYAIPTPVMLTSDEARANLARLIEERRYTHAELARAIGRNRAYIQQFITRGTPVRLAEQDRRTLAALLGVSEHELGGSVEKNRDSDTVPVPRLAVEASAGLGAFVDGEARLDLFGFPRRWLRKLTSAKAEDLSLIRIKGDSMAPTLVDGNEALVDGSQRDARREDGIYVLRRDDTLIVKRLTLTPGSGLLTVSSDNPAYPTWRDCAPGSLDVIGRVIAAIGQVR